jgi:23S rRNA pseudouridine1911/1915/1917 synthase
VRPISGGHIPARKIQDTAPAGPLAIRQLLHALRERLTDAVHLAVNVGVDRGHPFVIDHKRLDFVLGQFGILGVGFLVKFGLGFFDPPYRTVSGLQVRREVGRLWAVGAVTLRSAVGLGWGRRALERFRLSSPIGAMGSLSFTVVYEDNHLLVVSKPAMLPTMGVSENRPSLLKEAKAYLKDKHQKPGNVYLGTVSRLDAPVTGLVLFARTSKAAARLTEQFRRREVEKTYWAVVEGAPSPPQANCVDWMRKDERHRKMHVAHGDAPGAQEARLSYRTLGKAEGGRLLEVRLETGRKHQIRVQLAHRGFPIRGDRKYGGRLPFSPGIALHARQLELTHPVRKTPLSLEAPLPKSWRQCGLAAEFFS